MLNHALTAVTGISSPFAVIYLETGKNHTRMFLPPTTSEIWKTQHRGRGLMWVYLKIKVESFIPSHMLWHDSEAKGINGSAFPDKGNHYGVISVVLRCWCTSLSPKNPPWDDNAPNNRVTRNALVGFGWVGGLFKWRIIWTGRWVIIFPRVHTREHGPFFFYPLFICINVGSLDPCVCLFPETPFLWIQCNGP